MLFRMYNKSGNIHIYTCVHKVNGDTVNYSSDVPLNWDIMY